jgi:hypothetical protein
VQFAETAIFWFGRVDRTNNSVDVRVGYNAEHLYVSAAFADRRLWYDTGPTASELEAWDAVTLYLDLNSDGGSAPSGDDYRLVVQLSWWEGRDGYQTAYRGTGTGWSPAAIPFASETGWRGNAPNDGEDDRGWTADFYIAFSALGLSGPPARDTVWGMALAAHDRDDAAGTAIPDQVWPEGADGQQPVTWGELAFGLPAYEAPPAAPRELAVVRHGLNGASVMDGQVGGGAVCGDPYGPDYFGGWGAANYAGTPDFNIQNQADIADWPCFSRYYVTFPLEVIPVGKTIISATLTLHQFGNAGGPGEADPSLIQVLTVGEAWDEATLTWNNAPLAVENISAAWAYPLEAFPGWPGVPTVWDVSRAVAEAYAAGRPLRVALYEADAAYHSGKYFVSSDTGEWNAEARPTLHVSCGNPIGTVDKVASRTVVLQAEVLTYTLTVIGSGQALTLVDALPAGVGAPLARSPTLAYTPHRLTWSGAPDTGESVVLTYTVPISAPSRTALRNNVALTQDGDLADTASALVLVDPLQAYLPLVTRGR